MDLKKLIDYALTKNVDEVEFYHINKKNNKIQVYKSEVESLLSAVERGVAIRVFKDGKMGFSYTTDLTDSKLMEAIQEAIDGMNLITSTERRSLPVPAKDYPEVNIYNAELSCADIQTKIDLALEIEKSAYQYDPRVVNVPSVLYRDEELEVHLINSKGFDKKYRKSKVVALVNVIASDGIISQNGMSFQHGKDLKDIDPHNIGEDGARKAINLLGGSPIESGEVEVLFNNYAGSLLFSAFAPAFLANNVQKNKSLFKDKSGKQIASPLVTLVDDGLRLDGLRTAPFDAEGVPVQKTVVVEGGILKTYLYDSHTAQIDNVSSTGNAYRPGLQYNVEVAPINFYLQNGERSVEELISGIKRGILVMDLSGVHSGANFISGDFSVGATGVLIEDGKLTKPVREVTIAGNFIDLLKNIVAIGNDLIFNPATDFMGTPSFVVSKLALSGK